VNVDTFRIADLDEIELQPGQMAWREWGSPEEARALMAGTAITVRTDHIIACGGIFPRSKDVGHLWGVLAVDARRHLLALQRICGRLFEVTDYARVLANTESDFHAGCRWLKLMGFKYIETIERFGPDGRDHNFYVRVR